MHGIRFSIPRLKSISRGGHGTVWNWSAHVHVYGYLGISLQVVVEYVDTDGEVASVVGVGTVPALRAKLPALHYHGMEVDEREEDALELVLSSTHLQGVLRREVIQ